MRPEEINILVGCEESQAVTIELRKLGFNAFSCDTQDCTGEHPKWHFKCDVKKVMYGGILITQDGTVVEVKKWHAGIFFPPCTRICKSGVRWLHERNLWSDLDEACDFFNMFQEMGKTMPVAIENPVPHKYARAKIGYYNQKFQPWHFGHKQKKETCLWLYGLPPLIYTDIVGPPPIEKTERNKWDDIHRKMGNTPARKIFRSKTFPGIAKAIADQWGDYLLKTLQ